nr:hypothetical protein [Prevotella sp.]
MLQRDYFIRVLQEFTAALTRFLEKNEGEDKKDKDLIDLWRQYVGDYDTLRNLSFEELIKFSNEQWKKDERVDRLEMTAELLYAEASYKEKPLRDILLDKSFKVFDYVDANSSTFSIDRKTKMEQIRTLLGNI